MSWHSSYWTGKILYGYLREQWHVLRGTWRIWKYMSVCCVRVYFIIIGNNNNRVSTAMVNIDFGSKRERGWRNGGMPSILSGSLQLAINENLLLLLYIILMEYVWDTFIMTIIIIGSRSRVAANLNAQLKTFEFYTHLNVNVSFSNATDEVYICICTIYV